MLIPTISKHWSLTEPVVLHYAQHYHIMPYDVHTMPELQKRSALKGTLPHKHVASILSIRSSLRIHSNVNRQAFPLNAQQMEKPGRAQGHGEPHGEICDVLVGKLNGALLPAALQFGVAAMDTTQQRVYHSLHSGSDEDTC